MCQSFGASQISEIGHCFKARQDLELFSRFSWHNISVFRKVIWVKDTLINFFKTSKMTVIWSYFFVSVLFFVWIAWNVRWWQFRFSASSLATAAFSQFWFRIDFFDFRAIFLSLHGVDYFELFLLKFSCTIFESDYKPTKDNLTSLNGTPQTRSINDSLD